MDYTVTLSTGNIPPREYLERLHAALCELLKLVATQRELSLYEEQTEAIYIVIDLIGKLVNSK